MKKWLFFAIIGKCQNQFTPPYFDQLSERHQLLYYVVGDVEITMMMVLVLTMVRKRAIVKAPLVEVRDDYVDDGAGVGYDFKEEGW